MGAPGAGVGGENGLAPLLAVYAARERPRVDEREIDSLAEVRAHRVAGVTDEDELAVVVLPQDDVAVAGEGEPVEVLDVREHLRRLRAERQDALAPGGETTTDDVGKAVMALAEEEVAASGSEWQQPDQVPRPRMTCRSSPRTWEVRPTAHNAP